MTLLRGLTDFISAGNTSFYKIENGKRLCYDVSSGKYKPLPGGESFIILSDLKEKTVWKNSACNLYDLGDDVLGAAMEHKNGKHWQ